MHFGLLPAARTEPSGNARFTPGNTVHLRLLLNDGADGESTAHILTTSESARILRLEVRQQQN